MINSPKLLLVEDDEFAAEIMVEFLDDRGFETTAVFTATDAVSRVKNEQYSLLILDINLPDFDGYEVLKSLKHSVNLPIIVTSAYSDTQSKLISFKYGAADYMVKPIDLEELEARIWLQLSKSSEIKTTHQQMLFRIDNHQIIYEDLTLDLTRTEFNILSLLIQHSNHVVKRETLLSALSNISTGRSLDNHIKNIRKKIDDDGNKARILTTEYAVGYRLYNPLVN